MVTCCQKVPPTRRIENSCHTISGRQADGIYERVFMIVGKTHNIRVSRDGDYAILEQVGNGQQIRVHASQIPEFVHKVQATADRLLKKTNSGDSR